MNLTERIAKAIADNDHATAPSAYSSWAALNEKSNEHTRRIYLGNAEAVIAELGLDDTPTNTTRDPLNRIADTLERIDRHLETKAILDRLSTLEAAQCD